MFKFLRRKVKNNSIPKVDFGNFNLNSKEKSRSQLKKDKELVVNKINGKTNYYTVVFGPEGKSDIILHLSKEAKVISKKYPEVVKFIKDNLFLAPGKHKIFSKNKNLDLKLSPIKKKHGQNHLLLYKLDLLFKDTNINRKYFVKFVGKRGFSSSNEFIASKIFEKFGFNTIKPYLSFETSSRLKNVIIYDFSELKNVTEAYKNKIISEEELGNILEKVNSINSYLEKIGYGRESIDKRIVDFNRTSNIFVKREPNGELKLYFSDLLMINKEGPIK